MTLDTTLWTTASRDIEAEREAVRVARVATAASEFWPFLAASRSAEEYEHRKALVADKIYAAVETVAESGTGGFERLHGALVATLDDDFKILHESSQREAARQAESIQRAAQIITAALWKECLRPGPVTVSTPVEASMNTTSAERIKTDDRGVEYVNHGDIESMPRGWAQCGTCGKSWNDDKSTSVTPTPSGRCPFEYDHKYASLHMTASDSVTVQSKPKCDVCRINDNKDSDADYDARCPGLGGQWANVCQKHFDAYGPGQMGTGHAQRYEVRKTAASEAHCRHCDRPIVQEDGRWVDPEANGDDSIWRETCDAHDTFQAEHEPKTSAKTAGMPDIDDIMKWEDGSMSPEEEGTFFQGLIDSGLAWKLQGMYGRRATDLINSGVCHASKTAALNSIISGDGGYQVINQSGYPVSEGETFASPDEAHEWLDDWLATADPDDTAVNYSVVKKAFRTALNMITDADIDEVLTGLRPEASLQATALNPFEQWMVEQNLGHVKEKGAESVVKNLRDQGYDRVADAVEQQSGSKSASRHTAKDYSVSELEAMPTLHQGHTDDCKYDDGKVRIWHSRMTKEDGMPYDHQVTEEHFHPDSGRWETHREYQAKTASRGRHPFAEVPAISAEAVKWSPVSGFGKREDAKKPYKATHTYNPIGWDQFDAKPHPGSKLIAPGAKVMLHGKMDPGGQLMHISDEQGNHQTVDKRSLSSGGKKTSSRTPEELRAAVGDAMKRYLHPDYHADGEAVLNKTHDAVLDHLADMYGWTLGESHPAASQKEHHDRIADSVAAHVYETAPFTSAAPPRAHTASADDEWEVPEPTNSWPCQKCGTTVERYRGESDVSCPKCGAQYNASGQRLRDDWRGNSSNYDDDMDDMEGYERQYAHDGSLRHQGGLDNDFWAWAADKGITQDSKPDAISAAIDEYKAKESRLAASGSHACEYPGGNHSGDTTELWHGASTPLHVCGYHAQRLMNNSLPWPKASRLADRRTPPNTFSLSDAQNEDGEWTMSPEQIRAEQAASDGDQQDYYDDDDDDGYYSSLGRGRMSALDRLIAFDNSIIGGKFQPQKGDQKGPVFDSEDDADDWVKQQGDITGWTVEQVNTGSDSKTSRLTAEYHYIKQQGDKWVIWQKGTGKTLSTHNSKEQAESAFRAMMESKHGSQQKRNGRHLSALALLDPFWKAFDGHFAVVAADGLKCPVCYTADVEKVADPKDNPLTGVPRYRCNGCNAALWGNDITNLKHGAWFDRGVTTMGTPPPVAKCEKCGADANFDHQVSGMAGVLNWYKCPNEHAFSMQSTGSRHTADLGDYNPDPTMLQQPQVSNIEGSGGGGHSSGGGGGFRPSGSGAADEGAVEDLAMVACRKCVAGHSPDGTACDYCDGMGSLTPTMASRKAVEGWEQGITRASFIVTSSLTRSADGSPARPAGDSRHFHMIHPHQDGWGVYRIPRSQVGRAKSRNKVLVSSHSSHEEAVKALNTLKGKTAVDYSHREGWDVPSPCPSCGGSPEHPYSADKIHHPKCPNNYAAGGVIAAAADRGNVALPKSAGGMATHMRKHHRLTLNADDGHVWKPADVRSFHENLHTYGGKEYGNPLDHDHEGLPTRKSRGVTGASRCRNCTNGNHTGTNGTPGCTGKSCSCPCRKRSTSAINLDADGTARYETLPSPAIPGWIQQWGDPNTLLTDAEHDQGRGNAPGSNGVPNQAQRPDRVLHYEYRPTASVHTAAIGICGHCGGGLHTEHISDVSDMGDFSGDYWRHNQEEKDGDHSAVPTRVMHGNFQRQANPYSPVNNPYSTDGPGQPDTGGDPGDGLGGTAPSNLGDDSSNPMTSSPRTKPNTDYTDGSGGGMGGGQEGLSTQAPPSSTPDWDSSSTTSAPWRAAASLRQTEAWYASPARQRVAAKAAVVADDLQSSNPGLERQQALAFAVQTIRAFPRMVGGIKPSAIGGVLDRYLAELTHV